MDFRRPSRRWRSRSKARDIDVVVGVESRGFILGGAVADRLGAGFAPVRKKGKLPSKTVQETYDLEYGTDCLEIHSDAVEPGQRVLIIDDVLATGGTAAATTALVRKLGGRRPVARVSRGAGVPQRPLEDAERDGPQRSQILRMIALLVGGRARGLCCGASAIELQRQRREATIQHLLAIVCAGGGSRRSRIRGNCSRGIRSRKTSRKLFPDAFKAARCGRRRSVSVHEGAIEGRPRAMDLRVARMGTRARRRICA